jgi:mRNA turnover protein 4
MPKSKRAKVGQWSIVLFGRIAGGILIVSLTKTSKKTKEHKENLLKEIQDNAEKWEYIYVFEVGDMRNGPLKDVRRLWKEFVDLGCLSGHWLTSYSSTARIFFGRCVVMAKGLGTSVETEHRPGLHQLAEVYKFLSYVGFFTQLTLVPRY